MSIVREPACRFDAVLGARRGLPDGVPRVRDETITVINAEARAFTFRVLRKGDRYGTGRCLTHEQDAPSVEVFDATYAGMAGFDVLGQFTGARYYASTLLDRDENTGLVLHGGEPAWTLDAGAYAVAHAWLLRACA